MVFSGSLEELGSEIETGHPGPHSSRRYRRDPGPAGHVEDPLPAFTPARRTSSAAVGLVLTSRAAKLAQASR